MKPADRFRITTNGTLWRIEIDVHIIPFTHRWIVAKTWSMVTMDHSNPCVYPSLEKAQAAMAEFIHRDEVAQRPWRPVT